MLTQPEIREITLPCQKHDPNFQNSILSKWRWYDVNYGGLKGVTLDERIVLTKNYIEALIPHLPANDVAVFINFYGMVLWDGVIGVAAALINDDDGARFYLSNAESMKGGRGYVTSFLSIEYKEDSLTRIYEKTEGVLGNSDSRISILFVPYNNLKEAMQCEVGFEVLTSETCYPRLEKLLPLCRYGIFVRQDFDSFIIGAYEDYAKELPVAFSQVGSKTSTM